MERNRLSPLRLLFYAGPAIPLSMLTMPLVMYVPPFYAAEVGMSLAAVGGIFLLARAWDALIDPVIGMLSDRTGGRFGRRKPWILAGMPCLVVTTWMLCQPPSGAGLGYLQLWVFLFYLAWTMVQIPYLSWGAELSPDYHERSRVVGYREGCFMVGVLLATGLPIAVLGGGEEPTLREILHVFTVAITVLLPVVVLAAVFGVPERAAGPATVQQRPRLRDMLRLTAGNRPFVRLLAVTFCLWLGLHMYNAALLMVLQYALGFPGSVFLKLVFAQFVVGTLFTPMIVRIAGRISKHRALALGALGTAIALPAMMLVTPGATWQIMAIFIALGFVISPIWVLPTALVADVADYGALRGGGQSEGIYMALYNFVMKMALSASIGIVLPLLDLLGFDPAGANGPAELTSLQIVGLGLPAIILLIGAALLWHYPIDARRHGIIRRRLDARPVG